MRTFKVLLAGWLLGGAFIVLTSGAGGSTAVPRASRPRVVVPAAEPATIRPASGRPHVIAIPVQGIGADQLRDTFTEARGTRTHNAMDILAPRGTPVVAAVDGPIRKLFNSRAGGLTIYQFDRAEERVYYYAHLDRYADGVIEGTFVTQGTVIGYVGTSGNAPRDTPHLHFAVEVLPPTKEWWKGRPVNPYPLLTTPASALP